MELASAAKELAHAMVNFQEKSKIVMLKFTNNDSIRNLQQAAFVLCTSYSEPIIENQDVGGHSFSQDEDYWKDPVVLQAIDEAIEQVVAAQLPKVVPPKCISADGPSFNLFESPLSQINAIAKESVFAAQQIPDTTPTATETEVITFNTLFFAMFYLMFFKLFMI